MFYKAIPKNSKRLKKLWKKPLVKKFYHIEVAEVFLLLLFFEKILGAKSVLMGFGLDSDAIHSNEHYGLYNFYKGIESIPYFFEFYTQQ